MSEVVEEFLPAHPIAVLGGPNLACEVAQDLPAVTSIASQDIELSRAISDHCSSKNFKLLPSGNVFMTQLFGALKNVMAILCGAARGLKLGENFIGSLISVCAKEMMEIARYKAPKRADYKIFLEPAGIGDIFLTCSCIQSRNNSFGFECVTKSLGTNHSNLTKHATVEGLNTISALQAMSVQAPLLKDFALALTDGRYKTIHSVRSALIGLVLE
jgi:glycerol-3-phosphate dehydrogenase (NAD(P)+)